MDDNLINVFHSILVSDGQLMSPHEIRLATQGRPTPHPALDWCLVGQASEALYSDLRVNTAIEMMMHPVEGGAAGNHVIVSLDTQRAHHAFLIPMFDLPSQDWAASLGDRGIQFSVATSRQAVAKVFRGENPAGTQELLRGLYQDARSVDINALMDSLPRFAVQAAAITPEGMPERNEREIIRSVSLVTPRSLLEAERIRPSGTTQGMFH
jgi:hypothetical protein